MAKEWIDNNKIAFYAIVALALTALLVTVMPWLLTNHYICDSLDLSTDKDGYIGDTIGGISAPIIGIGAALLTFFAFWVQYKFNKEQSAFLQKERFENNFFEMLQLHESITNSLSVIGLRAKEKGNTIEHKGRDVFQFIYEEYPILNPLCFKAGSNSLPKGGNDLQGIRSLMMEGGNDRLEKYASEGVVRSLDHYFRQLYRIFKYIDDAQSFLDDKERYSYVGIARSTLSKYELVMLFYNCLSENGIKKFKPLIEKYAILKNFRQELLALESDYGLYGCGAYEHIVKSEHKMTYADEISQ